jgi:hypothetical protein
VPPNKDADGRPPAAGAAGEEALAGVEFVWEETSEIR